MLLDLSEIVIREGMRVGLDVDQAGVEDPDLIFASPLKGHLDFENGGDLINIRGQAKTELLVPCSRCLTDVQLPVQLPVDEHFPIEEVLHPDRPPAEGEEFDTVVSTVVYLEQGRPILDLDELFRQLLVTEIPIQTLCSEACSGLCPHCGVNRNETPCRCAEEQRNTPLASLAALLGDGDGEQDPNH
jgi:uncharacterized protein